MEKIDAFMRLQCQIRSIAGRRGIAIVTKESKTAVPDWISKTRRSGPDSSH
jgi:hypothetical protein